MGLLSYATTLRNSFSLSPSAQLIDPLGSSIAQRCYTQLSELVGPTILAMTPAEARGYTRAIIGPTIRSLVDDVVNCYELDRRLCLPLAERVLDVAQARIFAERNIAASATVISLPLKRAA